MLLIAYASKTGTTERCAKKLAEYLPGATLCDLAKESPELSKYDEVIIGSPIRGGKILAPVKNFVAASHDALLGKRVEYFVCCAYMDQDLKYFADNFPLDLLKASVNYRCLGGKLDLTELHGMDLFMANLVNKHTPAGTPPPRLREKEMMRLARDFDDKIVVEETEIN